MEGTVLVGRQPKIYSIDQILGPTNRTHQTGNLIVTNMRTEGQESEKVFEGKKATCRLYRR
jgi:hypothetical protein